MASAGLGSNLCGMRPLWVAAVLVCLLLTPVGRAAAWNYPDKIGTNSTAAESGVGRLGCYSDRHGTRDLPELHQARQLTGRRYCLGYCRTRGYLYFGLQGGSWCTCGNAYGRYERLGDAECNTRCDGNRSETCGASMKNEVFTTGVEERLGNSSESLGCFIDSEHSRDLTLMHRADRWTTKHFCRSYCRSNGYRYFGLQNRDWCACGNSFGNLSKVREAFCDIPCQAEPHRMCGGVNKNLVFATGIPDWETQGSRIGCFVDNVERDLPLVHNAGHKASRQHCWHYCSSRGYAHFGLQAGSYCTCGDKYGQFGRLSDGMCSMSCMGEERKTCGSGMSNEVFSTGLPDWKKRVTRLGCFVDAESRDLPLVQNMGDTGNAFTCYSFCSQRGYKYFGLQEGKLCLCGNEFGRHGQAANSADCATACAGDASKTCGGTWRSEIFATGIESAAERAVHRLGCFQDGTAHDLPLQHQAGDVTTRLVCWHFCQLRGYKYFGLQGGQYCMCGSRYGRYGQAPESHCSMRCAGDSAETCGHAFKNEVFTTGVPNWDSGVLRMGCFVDETADRDLPVLLDAGHLASRHYCLTYCRSNGYKYFGLQNAVNCTCGNAYGRHGQVDDAECSQTCRGDATTTCGGQMRNEIFTTGVERWDVNVTRQGCFRDSSGDRDLPLVNRTGASTRRQLCWHFCQSRGYRYFGLQSGAICACGNSFGRHGRVNDSECGVRCLGDAGETCGGEDRNEVFTTGVWDWESGFLDLGCFEDRASRDLLVVYHAKSNSHKHFCWNYCRSRGYQYFGLQAGSWCTCGDIFSRYQRRDDSECSHPCEGDESTMCGASMRNRLFTTGINQWENQVNSIGCFQDSPLNRTRTPPVVHKASKFSFGTHYCWLYCRSRSYKYFSMREEFTCLCGSSYDRFGLVRDAECGESCMGAVRTSCGDTSRTAEVFSTGLEAWEQGVTRLGCFVDVETNRDLPVELDAGNKLTKQFCWSFCHARGHKYFALQDRRLCFCGSDYGRHGRADDGDCTERCRGDASTTCGAHRRSEVFTTGIGDWDREVTRVGCFIRGTERDLVLEHDMANLATRYLCWKRCTALGYKYFGMHGGQKCACGNTYGHVDLGQMCNTKCRGDERSTCGGTGQSEVFTTGLDDSWRNFTTSMGCFIDKADDPDLAAGLHHLGEAATLRACWRLCRSLGQRYFALQASQWCACGNSFGRHGRADRGDCRLPCLGDPGDTCGGHLRNDVFDTDN